MQCSYLKADGKRCKAAALTYATDKMCLWHTNDPETVAKRHQANSSGGMSYRGLNLKVSKGKVKDSRDVQQFLGEVFENMKTGSVRITANQMSGIAALAQAYIKAEEKSNTLSRLENLEKAFLQQKKSNEKK